MVRIHIQLTGQQAAALKTLAIARNVSVAALIRSSVDSLLQREAASTRDALVARGKSVIGRFSSGFTAISENHDDHLADAFASQ